MNNSTAETIHVRIISPQQLILDTEASSVSSANLEGKFDILPLHANFITLVEKTPITIQLPEAREPLVFNFPMAIIVTLDNRVDIYTYIQPELKTTAE